jgi:FG-GAP-like repeat
VSRGGQVVAAALLVALFGAAALAEGGESPAAGPGVSYVESSTGLSTPQWEGGMTELEFADLDGDGHLDLISIGDHGNPGIQSTEHGVLVWFGNGAGAWAHYQTGDFGYGGIAVGDLDGDGKPDIAYAMHHNYSATDFGDQLIEAARGDGTGRNWTPWDDGLEHVDESRRRTSRHGFLRDDADGGHERRRLDGPGRLRQRDSDGLDRERRRRLDPGDDIQHR